jgi:UDP-N-acetylglucosamine 1-carboxyvinyltransferase
VDLATYLTSWSRNQRGGDDTIKIFGVSELKAANHTIIPDRIEAGTFMVAAAITGGDVVIDNVVTRPPEACDGKLREAGVEVSEELTSIRVKGNRSNLLI